MRKRNHFAVGFLLTISIGSADFLSGQWIQGKSNWFFPVDEIRFYTSERPETISDAIETIDQISKLYSSKNIDLYMSVVPIRARIYQSQLPDNLAIPQVILDRYANAQAEFLRSGVKTIDLNAAFLSSPQRLAQYPLYLRGDHHWAGQGGLLAAQLLSTAISKSGKVASSNVVQSEISFGQPRILPKTPLARDGQPLPSEQTETYIPISVKTDGAQSLLGDDSFPIAVVGDSFSNGERDGVGLFAYASLIEHFTQRRVYNAAQPGKGPWIPMFDYIKSNVYQDTPPNVINWESWEAFLTGDGQGYIPDDFLKKSGPLILGMCKNPYKFKVGQGVKIDPGQYIVADDLSEDVIHAIFSKGRGTTTTSSIVHSEGRLSFIFPGEFGEQVVLRLQNKDNSFKSSIELNICNTPSSYLNVLKLDGKVIDYAKRNYRNQLDVTNFYMSNDLQESRWGLNSGASIRFISTKKTSGTLTISGRSIFKGEIINISSNDKVIGTLTPNDGSFRFSSPIITSIGYNTIQFSFSKYRDSDEETKSIVKDSRPLAVNFDTLKIDLR